MAIIDSFSGENRYLSNFANIPVVFNGIKYDNSEAAFQAQKCDNANEMMLFVGKNPSEAKHLGREVKIRKDWEEIKFDLMHQIVYAKFNQNSIYQNKLLRTGDATLIEGNWWHDNIWGDCKCPKCSAFKGKNWLGKILMQVRTELSSS